MRKVLTTVVGVSVVSLALFAIQTPASAGAIVVPPGGSIHDAVKAAQPGDTIQLEAGVYQDVVVVKTDGITIQGVGGGTDGTIIRPPKKLPGRCFGGVAGICVFGDRRENVPVDGVTVTGVRIEGYAAFGMIAILARNTTFQESTALDNGEYGIAAFDSHATVMLNNVVSGNAEAGLYVGDSPHAGANLAGNESFDNGFGIFLRESAHGDITSNSIHDNCAGILMLDEPGAPRAGRYHFSENDIRHNSRVCKGGGQDPLSGIGIALAGGRGNVIEGNVIARNRAGGPTFLHGGVVLFGGAGGPSPSNNTVSGNDLIRNHPNVFTDGSGNGNEISNNSCIPSC